MSDVIRARQLHAVAGGLPRAVKPDEHIADIEEASWQALEAAVKAFIAAGYDFLPYPSENPAVVQTQA